MRVAVKDLKQGDLFLHAGKPIWRALEDAAPVPARIQDALAGGAENVAVTVQFLADGGTEFRQWADPEYTLDVEREDVFETDAEYRARADREFVTYLEDTLIPDLREAGSECTAEDFERCVLMLRERGV